MFITIPLFERQNAPLSSESPSDGIMAPIFNYQVLHSIAQNWNCGDLCRSICESPLDTILFGTNLVAPKAFAPLSISKLTELNLVSRRHLVESYRK